MKLFTRTKVIGSVALVATTVGGAVVAAPLSEGAPAEEAACPMSHEDVAEESASSTSNTSEGSREAFGPVAMVAHALSKVCLDDQQRAAIEQLGEDVVAKDKEVRSARKELRSALVHQLEQGKIDEDDLADEVDELVRAREEASPVLRKALEDLHGILEPEQRTAFVGALESRMKEVADASAGWFDSFSTDLELSDEQKQQIGDVLARAKPELDEERERAKAVFDEFEKDDFSVEKIVPLAEVGERTRQRAEGMIAIAKELVDILTPEQRVLLAQKIEGVTAKSAAEKAITRTTHQAIVVSGGSVRAGAVRGWGGGYGGVRVAGGYAARGVSVRTGYAAGYPLGGYGPGVW